MPGNPLFLTRNEQGKAVRVRSSVLFFPANRSGTRLRYTAEVSDGGDNQRQRTERELRLLYRAVAASSNGITISDSTAPDEPLIYVNRSFELMTGYSSDEVLGRNCRFLQGDDGDQPALLEVRAALREGRDCEVLLRNYRKDGTPFWNELRLSPVHEERGRLVNFVGVQNDVTQRKRAEEELRRAHDELDERVRQRTARLAESNARLKREIAERRELEEQLIHQAFHDPLSGLPNRSLFLDRLELSLTGALKRGAKVAVLLANVDGFRTVNESLGYEAGDRLLLAVAERLVNTVGPRGTVAHFGGDQFAVLLEDVASGGDAVQVARRIEEGLRRPLDLGGLEWTVTTSIGIGLSTPRWEPPGEIVRRADAAMYRAKEAGKGRHAIFDPGADEGTSA
jgi:diguanylate cyclase (GGDEF)-like protein/PAS domain S-box-containing protein